jgi:hypothetical protein
VTPSWNQFPPYFPQVLPSYLSTEELVLSGKKYLWLTASNIIINTISSNHKPPNSIISATSKTINSLLFMTQGVNGYTTLSLFCGDTVMYPTNRPNIQMLVRQIEELG